MKRFWFLLVAAIGAMSPAARAQVNCSSSSTKLICLIPNQLNLSPGSSQSLAFLNEAVGSQVSELPVATPASGIIYTNDPKLNLPVPSNETLGPVLTQRAETIGRHKVYIAFTYQYFLLQDIDGLSLKNLPIFLPLQTGTAVTATNNRLDLKANQFTGYVTYGLTGRIDLSVAVPVLDVHEQFTSSGVEFSLVPPFGSATFNNISKAGEVTGVGDVTLAIKGRVWKPRHGGFSLGAEVRLPSGDALNFLGAGTIGFRPFGTLTYGGRFSPHFNIAYEVNGSTDLITNSQGGKGQLPNRLLYSGGADWGVTKWLTLAADVLEQRVFDAQRIKLINFSISNPNLTFPSISPFKDSYNRTDGSAGVKIKPFGNLIITGNVVVKLDHAGLRSRLVPLVGASYTF